ncbi:EF-hand calcium-binding domain-containing protein 11 isoform X3 [Anolis carolinensis]|uniref:EF-hand calcium-binding domain-containing protein 11 isoform X3 n=1 Tax=Anolis carolinensis TaxID=28377 RepID=UPI002F2B2CF9
MSAALEMPEAGGRDRSQRKQWEKVFEACDEDKKGYLNREDYKVAVVMLFGYKPSKAEVNSVMASVKQNQSGKGFLSLEDLKKAFNIVAPKLPERTIVEVFRSELRILQAASGVRESAVYEDVAQGTPGCVTILWEASLISPHGKLGLTDGSSPHLADSNC